MCAAIRDTAASQMVDRSHDVLEIPSMVDLTELYPADRVDVRVDWGLVDEVPMIGWVARLNRKNRVEEEMKAPAPAP